jgi:hypothetical protein
MFTKRISLLTLLLALMLAATPVTAQAPGPLHSDPTWQATYWNNTTLSGTPVLLRAEANIDYNWGNGSPAPGTVNTDNFSVRWTRYIDVTPGTYVFTATADDGIRVWVDDALIIDQWYERPATTYTAEKSLSAGHHLITVEYFEKGGFAVARLQWQLKSQTPTITQWRGEYFNDITLGGTPVLVRNDAAINFDWGTGSPAPGVVNADRFSVRWTQTLNFTAATYRFTLTVDDGARLWVNGHLLVDAWIDQAPRTYTGDLYLPTGPATIELQYYENAGGAVAKLSWTGGTTPPTPTPPPSGTVIVDDRDAGFTKGGPAAGWRYESEGYSNTLTWTTNNYNANSNYNWGRWYPQLVARRYEVFVYIPHRFTTSGQARYWINHADGYTLRIVDQSAYSNQWVSLGTYRFLGTGADYVSLADVTFETTRSRLVAWDAVKWEPR